MSYLDRLRPASFTSPSGKVIPFKYLELSREVGKKAVISEILDSDRSIAQDLGLQSPVFSVEALFTGEDYDQSADSFWAALSERYKPSKSGKLNHPRWGNIDVIPMSWSQKEQFVSNAQMAVFNVTFRKSFPDSFPTLAIISGIGKLEALLLKAGLTPDQIKNIKLQADNVSNFVAKVTMMKDTAMTAVKSVTSVISATTTEINAIVAEGKSIERVLMSVVDDPEGNVFLLLASVQNLIRLPENIFSSLKSKVNVYGTMIEDILSSFSTSSGTADDIANNQIMSNLMVATAVQSMALATLSEVITDSEKTDVERAEEEAAGTSTVSKPVTRVDCLNAIDANNAVLELYQDSLAGEVDHDVVFYVQATVAAANQQLLSMVYDLKAERRTIVTGESDIITQTYKHYGTCEAATVAYMASINGLQGDEFLSLSTGREIISYA
jgi:prophage DNA circulation protein